MAAISLGSGYSAAPRRACTASRRKVPSARRRSTHRIRCSRRRHRQTTRPAEVMTACGGARMRPHFGQGVPIEVRAQRLAHARVLRLRSIQCRRIASATRARPALRRSRESRGPGGRSAPPPCPSARRHLPGGAYLLGGAGWGRGTRGLPRLHVVDSSGTPGPARSPPRRDRARAAPQVSAQGAGQALLGGLGESLDGRTRGKRATRRDRD